MSIGNVNSNKPGSGARFNAEKDPLEFVPVRYWMDKWSHAPLKIKRILENLTAWQEGTPFYIPSEISYQDYVDAAYVFEYGAVKYAAWNWAKGMKWSVPLGCTLRHIRDILEKEELSDPESGLKHMGHIVCNLIMIEWYYDHYQEGDDRPPKYC